MRLRGYPSRQPSDAHLAVLDIDGLHQRVELLRVKVVRALPFPAELVGYLVARMSGACRIQRGKRKMAQMTKSVRMRGMNLLHFVLMVAVMTIASPSTISELNKKAYVNIENWRKRPLTGRYPYVYVDGIYLKRNWGGEYENVSILVAVGVAEDGYREVLGAQEGMKEDKASWQSFFKWLKGRGLDGVRLVVGDKCLGMLEAVGEVFPEAKYQRCIVHFYRNVFTVTPRGKMRDVTYMLKAIHAQETREAAREKAQAVVQKLREMRLKEAAKKVEDGIEETLTYYAFPSEHWLKIRTNNMLERLNREIRRRTRVVGTFPDGESALMLVCARLRHVAGTQWGVKRYMSMKSLEQMDREKHGADDCDLA